MSQLNKQSFICQNPVSKSDTFIPMLSKLFDALCVKINLARAKFLSLKHYFYVNKLQKVSRPHFLFCMWGNFSLHKLPVIFKIDSIIFLKIVNERISMQVIMLADF